MAVVNWPSTLTYRPLFGTIAIGKTAEAPLVSDMNSGTQRRRKKYTLRVAEYDFQILMTNAEAMAFKLFHETILFDGAQQFRVPIWFAGTFADRVCTFREPPTYEHVTQQHVKISLALLIEDL